MSEWLNTYPRPQMRRESFYSLNGQWQLNGQGIEVPFCPQATLSGYQGPMRDHGIYHRRFPLPAHFYEPAQRVLLHFGAVDQIADVYLNEHWVGHHEGGYLPFYFDITDLLQEENDLCVKVTDTLSHDYPYGKQRLDRGGMWYTPVSGIWQTVWLEAVPDHAYIENIRITPSLSGIHLEVKTDASHCHLSISLDQESWEWDMMTPTIDLLVPEEKRQLWTPDHPVLYHLEISTTTDHITSYFALREVEVKGRTVYLNHQPLWMNGVLDQGYFMDGLFLPAKPEGYEQDIRNMKALGYNTIRKHIKIEPEQFYFACDRLGMLVVQDMVNNGHYSWFWDTVIPNVVSQWRPDRYARTKRQRTIFQKHMLDTLDHLYNHPCIIVYTIFNEGWGQFQADFMYDQCRAHDPSRLYDATSGWFKQKRSDFDSQHVYFKTRILSTKQEKPMFLSECGGYTRAVAGHLFASQHHYGYGACQDEATLTDRIIQLYEKMVLPSLQNGLCGCIYTQLSDVEDEINGLYTCDRQILKVDQQRLSAMNAFLQQAFLNIHQEP